MLQANPSLATIQDKTILLKFIYHKYLLEFPLLRTNAATVQPRVEDLLLQYPTFSSLLKYEEPKLSVWLLCRKAKKDNGRSGVLVDIFDLAIVTSLEHKTKESLQGEEALTMMRAFSARWKGCCCCSFDRREIFELLQIVLKDVAQEGTILRSKWILQVILLPSSRLFWMRRYNGPFFGADIIENMDDIPPIYRKLFGVVYIGPM